MPNNKSVLKRERQNLEARKRNRIVKSKVHTALLKLLESINAKNRDETESRLRLYMSEVHKAVKNNIFHKNKGARRIARIVKKIKNTFNEHKAA
ncbi:MAG: 30S ribosomal protein S20 [Spirochaetes bacterium]|nr:30S ribosomal protein S20 [Spirochaetota bacterium]